MDLECVGSMEQIYSRLVSVIIDGVQSGKEQMMSDSTCIEKLREEVEKLCGNCNRLDEEELGKIILSSMTFGFSIGLNTDRPQGEWIKTTPWSYGAGMGEVYGYYQKCSNCGKEFMYKSNFCPKCGVRMKEVDDGE